MDSSFLVVFPCFVIYFLYLAAFTWNGIFIVKFMVF
jgi:hypothetical protein